MKKLLLLVSLLISITTIAQVKQKYAGYGQYFPGRVQIDGAFKIPTKGNMGVKDYNLGFDTAQLYYNPADSLVYVHTGTQWIPMGGTGTGITDGDKGDMTVSGSGLTWTIDNDVVTYAKLQNISNTNRFLGRITGGAGDAEELTGTQATTLLDVFTSGLKGLAPASGGGTTNFLRADGTWAAPTAGAETQDLQDVTDIGNVTTNNIFARNLYAEGDGTESWIYVSDASQSEGYAFYYNDANKLLKLLDLTATGAPIMTVSGINQVNFFQAFAPNDIQLARNGGFTYFNSGLVGIGSNTSVGSYTFQVTGTSYFSDYTEHNTYIKVKDNGALSTASTGFFNLGVNADKFIGKSDGGTDWTFGGETNTQTLTNKRITPRVQSITSSATPTPNIDDYDVLEITALATGATFGAPTGTPTNKQLFRIVIEDNGGAQTLAFNSIYRAGDITFPTTTIAGKKMILGIMYDAVDNKYDLVTKIDNF
jgi:hypothetical protein